MAKKDPEVEVHEGRRPEPEIRHMASVTIRLYFDPGDNDKATLEDQAATVMDRAKQELKTFGHQPKDREPPHVRLWKEM